MIARNVIFSTSVSIDGVNDMHGEVRNVKPAFKRGLWLGLLNAGIESLLGGRTPWTLRNTASYPLEKLADYESPNRLPRAPFPHLL